MTKTCGGSDMTPRSLSPATVHSSAWNAGPQGERLSDSSSSHHPRVLPWQQEEAATIIRQPLPSSLKEDVSSPGPRHGGLICLPPPELLQASKAFQRPATALGLSRARISRPGTPTGVELAPRTSRAGTPVGAADIPSPRTPATEQRPKAHMPPQRSSSQTVLTPQSARRSNNGLAPTPLSPSAGSSSASPRRPPQPPKLLIPQAAGPAPMVRHSPSARASDGSRALTPSPSTTYTGAATAPQPPRWPTGSAERCESPRGAGYAGRGFASPSPRTTDAGMPTPSQPLAMHDSPAQPAAGPGDMAHGRAASPRAAPPGAGAAFPPPALHAPHLLLLGGQPQPTSQPVHPSPLARRDAGPDGMPLRPYTPSPRITDTGAPPAAPPGSPLSQANSRRQFLLNSGRPSGTATPTPLPQSPKPPLHPRQQVVQQQQQAPLEGQPAAAPHGHAAGWGPYGRPSTAPAYIQEEAEALQSPVTGPYVRPKLQLPWDCPPAPHAIPDPVGSSPHSHTLTVLQQGPRSSSSAGSSPWPLLSQLGATAEGGAMRGSGSGFGAGAAEASRLQWSSSGGAAQAQRPMDQFEFESQTWNLVADPSSYASRGAALASRIDAARVLGQSPTHEQRTPRQRLTLRDARLLQLASFSRRWSRSGAGTGSVDEQERRASSSSGVSQIQRDDVPGLGSPGRWSFRRSGTGLAEKAPPALPPPPPPQFSVQPSRKEPVQMSDISWWQDPDPESGQEERPMVQLYAAEGSCQAAAWQSEYVEEDEDYCAGTDSSVPLDAAAPPEPPPAAPAGPPRHSAAMLAAMSVVAASLRGGDGSARAGGGAAAAAQARARLSGRSWKAQRGTSGRLRPVEG